MQRPNVKPRYQVLAELLRSRIHDGDLIPGDRLPSEAELCLEFGVSRGTVVKAVEQLVSEGIVHRHQGSGSFVARPSLHRRAGGLLSFTEAAAGGGHRSSQQLVDLRAATPEEIREFDCGQPAVSLIRLRHVDDVPCAVHHSLVPSTVAMRIPALNGEAPEALKDPGFSLYRSFEDIGLAADEAQERVTTRLANDEERRLLGLSGPAAVMVVFRKSFDRDGQLIEAVEAVYHGDYYTYDMRLVRGRDTRSSSPAGQVVSLKTRIDNSDN
ncbi:GntR family transcriptional regulator [Hoeflea sp. CAU 1731]